ncbi:Uncharacterised protein [Neisseria gonorrhoeae]|uniref:Uncharacterized protein n=1 Tax=Neisseria gonorrhoeae TaxID=485 RepID=A0A378VXE0_NEIGO|nr:Uncharacterised protein [Neisseria gonorrhoeae]
MQTRILSAVLLAFQPLPLPGAHSRCNSTTRPKTAASRKTSF